MLLGTVEVTCAFALVAFWLRVEGRNTDINAIKAKATKYRLEFLVIAFNILFS